MDQNLKVSICIPCYEMNGFGVQFLNHNLNMISKQTYSNIEIIISDHSLNNNIYDLSTSWNNKLNIKHFFNPNNRGNSSSNLNNALTRASGDLIKIIFQDDFLYNENSIQITVDHFTIDNYWVVSSCEHTIDGIHFIQPFTPHYHDNIHLGANTISSPSVLSFKNQNIELFDEQLIWLMDVEHYKRLHDKYGDPTIINEITVVNRTWQGQVSSSMPQIRKQTELDYVQKKYLN